MNLKKKLFFIIAFFLCINFVFSLDNSIISANRRTAVRCLKLSESYLSSKEWANALSQAELGLAYDDSIADLFYVKACAKVGLNEPISEIIPLVTIALTEKEWVDYNRDNARILYADLLCTTGNFDQSLNILNAEPFIYSSDAEYIRVKSLYRIGTQKTINQAREKIDTARKIYSSDTRFPLLFLKNEYDLCNGNTEELLNENALVKKITESFIAKIPEYDNPDDELEIYAILFSLEEEQLRLLQAFTAHNLRHPLYAYAALKNNLISQEEAWSYFSDFAKETININYIQKFIPLLTEDSVKEQVRQFFLSYEGTICIDTDNDLEANLFINYSRGRALDLTWDSNNDGINDLLCEFDFGSPVKVSISNGNVELTYGTYPYIVNALYKSDLEQGSANFVLADESFEWTPFDIQLLNVLKDNIDFDFYVPYALVEVPEINDNLLLYNCSSYKVPSKEKENAMINFSVVKGMIHTAEYSVNGIPYANAYFEDGMPLYRNIDNDMDGIFEVTEFYNYDIENKMGFSIKEQEQLMTNLFGLPMAGSGIYLSKIQFDSNLDTVADFIEEYYENEGKTSSWDFDNDGNWDVRYRKYPKLPTDEFLMEDAMFYKNPSRQLVVITFMNKAPVKVSCDNLVYNVTSGVLSNFYWIGTNGNKDDEVFIQQNIDANINQGVCVILQNENKRYSAVKINNDFFIELIPDNDDGDKIEESN